MDTYRKIIDINVLGVIAGVKKCLPMIRQAKGSITFYQSSSYFIINIFMINFIKFKIVFIF